MKVRLSVVWPLLIISTVFFILLLFSGCASHRVVMPQMDLPTEPVKPKIQSQVITQGDKAFVAYTVPESLKLYEFLLRKDSYEEKLRYRLDAVNQLLQGK